MSLKVLVIFLVCLILTIIILDSPEYVRCIHIGLCEFLETYGHLDNILKSDILRHISDVIKNDLFFIFESLINSKHLIQNLTFFLISAILKYFKILFALTKGCNTVLPNTEHTSILFENNLNVQALKLVKVSVILS
jgi:hypothetical protein